MGVYLYPSGVETPLKGAYIGIPNPESIVLDKNSINLTTVGQTEQLTATIEPTISDHSITWSSDDTTVATVSTTGLVTCVTPGTCTITATTVNGLTATCGVTNQSGWTPDPTRTIFYYDFEDSNNRLADSSGNNNDATGATAITYTTVGTQTVAETTGNPCGITIPQNLYGNIGTGDFALSFWIYCIDTTNTQYPMLFGLATLTSPYPGITIFFNPRDAYSQGNAVLWRLTGANQKAGYKQASDLVGGWHHFVITRNSGTVDCYIDATLDQTFTDNTSLPSSCGQNWILSRVGSTDQSFSAGAKGDKFIFEEVGWSAANVDTYFNQTKSIYGIS